MPSSGGKGSLLCQDPMASMVAESQVMRKSQRTTFCFLGSFQYSASVRVLGQGNTGRQEDPLKQLPSTQGKAPGGNNKTRCTSRPKKHGAGHAPWL